MARTGIGNVISVAEDNKNRDDFGRVVEKLGTNRCTAQVKQPRRGQNRSLLHPVRVAVHEDPKPVLKVDERPDHVGR